MWRKSFSDNEMRATRAVYSLTLMLFGLLVAAHALAFYFTEIVAPLRLRSPKVTLFSSEISGVIDEADLHDALFLSQPVLLAVWAILGPGRWYSRWLCVLGLGAILAWNMLRPGEVSSWFGADNRVIADGFVAESLDWLYIAMLPTRSSVGRHLLAIEMLVVVAALICLRLRRYSLRRIESCGPAGPGFRFSVRALFVATVAAAVSVWLGLKARDLAIDSQPVPQWLVVVGVGLPGAVIALLSLWTALPQQAPWWRLLSLAVAASLLGLIAPYLFGREVYRMTFVSLAAWQALIYCATLLVVRGCGWRLARASQSGPHTPCAGTVASGSAVTRATQFGQENGGPEKATVS
jgi:hypothetical protein